jgi:uncharacterized protein (TIGR03435 family)
LVAASRDRFYIQAKAPGAAGDSDMMIMLQSLLADRFKLTLHRESRPLSGYALVPAKGGAKLKPSLPKTPSRTNSSRGSIVAQACTMTLFAMKLSEGAACGGKAECQTKIASLTSRVTSRIIKPKMSPNGDTCRPVGPGMCETVI